MTLHSRPSGIPEIPADPRPAQYQRLAREIDANTEGLEPLRIAMLASFTLDFLRPVLVVEGARIGCGVDLFLGDFGQLEQAVLDTSSGLDAYRADVLVLNFQPADIAPDVVDRYYASQGRDLAALCEDLTARLILASRTFRDKTGRPALIANFAVPDLLPLGPFDAGRPDGVTHSIAAANVELTGRVSEEADVYVWDYAGLIRESGSATWSDERLRMLARIAVASEKQPRMARHLLRTITALRRRPAKCLVVDLDNTLWGGVVGDDGVDGLRLGDDWPGLPYKVFQRTVLGLRDRGVVLAIASKNDESVAAAAFEKHPEMVLSWDDFAAVRINWEPKSVNMRAIAEDLNIGTDALVLFDDNPVERAEVRAGLPEAAVIEVPPDPSGYRRALLQSGFFDQVGLSPEDLDRAEMYKTERARATLRHEAPSLEEFLRDLEMVAEVGVADPETLPRIAQLIGKTNQFNLTTRRHTPADVAAMAAAEDTAVAWLRLRDRFGDQGLIAVGIVQRSGDEARLDTFLMSCRVMNRGVETAMMAYLGELATEFGARKLVGEYRPTPKNHMVKSLFPSMGFDSYGQSEDGTLWCLETAALCEMWPSHIDRAPAAGRQLAQAET